ncbi:MAG: glycosyltransferase family 39 protein, partial [Leptospiraceae bacterium]|nr:glycosyltransferase family 39 protein [Leptospiraceae bacterium]
MFYSIGLGIVPDEAYYWEWSRNLDLSYYDQGPGTGYFIRLFTLFLGDTLFALKFGANLSSLLTAFLIYLTGRRIGLDGYQLFWLILLINIAPGLMGGSFLIMHDSPLVLCWSAGIYVS